MTALGIFLLGSLFFVVAGMAQFAVLLFLLRRSEHSLQARKLSLFSSNTVNANDTLEYVGDRRSMNGYVNSANPPNNLSDFIYYANKIDFTATILFPISYFLFNMIYWFVYID